MTDKNVLVTNKVSHLVPSSQVKKSKLIAIISTLFKAKDRPLILSVSSTLIDMMGDLVMRIISVVI